MEKRASIRINGIGVSPGRVSGEACLIEASSSRYMFRHISPDETKGELSRLEEAIAGAQSELEAIRAEASQRFGDKHLFILDVGLMLIRDEILTGEAKKRIEERLFNAEWAIQGASEHFAQIFMEMDDDYFKDRRFDIAHAAERILRHLAKTQIQLTPENPAEPVILVARDLSPADVAAFSRERVVGFVTESGGRTSHTAIFAEALGIPAVIGAHGVTRQTTTGDRLIIDGESGWVDVNPAQEEGTSLGHMPRAYRPRPKAIDRSAPAVTRDGHRINIQANIEHEQELSSLHPEGIDGVGLYRSDNLYFNRPHLPSEEDLYRQYRRLAEVVGPKEAVVRTPDLGADRPVPGLTDPPGEVEPNPALGTRAIRLTLKHPEMFKTQLKAFLRATRHGNLSLMYPMVSGIEELRAAMSLLQESKDELRARGEDFQETVRQGILIETPAAAICADILSSEVDFLSIGSNDLTQYTLAVDRLNSQVADLYEPLHPAMIRLLHGLAETARSAHLPITVCGQLASEPLNALCLVGLGFHTLSMTLSKMPAVKQAIRQASLEELEGLGEKMLDCRTTEEVQRVIQDAGRILAPKQTHIRPAV